MSFSLISFSGYWPSYCVLKAVKNLGKKLYKTSNTTLTQHHPYGEPLNALSSYINTKLYNQTSYYLNLYITADQSKCYPSWTANE